MDPIKSENCNPVTRVRRNRRRLRPAGCKRLATRRVPGACRKGRAPAWPQRTIEKRDRVQLLFQPLPCPSPKRPGRGQKNRRGDHRTPRRRGPAWRRPWERCCPWYPCTASGKSAGSLLGAVLQSSPLSSSHPFAEGRPMESGKGSVSRWLARRATPSTLLSETCDEKRQESFRKLAFGPARWVHCPHLALALRSPGNAPGPGLRGRDVHGPVRAGAAKTSCRSPPGRR
jgi:hypothetical protein